MDKDKLVELAERCEAATGPDDATDWAIAEAVGCAPGLPYTASLDAATKLVPDDAWWSVMRAPCADGFYAEVGSDDHRHAATPALALCAAALRSHAQPK